MSTVVLHPQALSEAELDTYLERGWYRIGQTLMTCRYYIANGDVFSTIWTRTVLENFQFSRSNRKLLARNGRRFRTTIGPATIDPVREALYQRYLSVARGERSASLSDFLGGDDGQPLFHTYEIGVWDGDRLVALSLFDIGKQSVQSLLGAYDPEYKSHSLGYYSLLLEVQYALDQDRAYHYSGYVVPGLPFMDYKWRVGHMQFLDPDRGGWRPESELDQIDDPADRLRSSLHAVKRELARQGVASEIRINEMFEGRHIDPVLSTCLDQPMALECFPSARQRAPLMVTWDAEKNSYELLRCLKVAGRLVPADGDQSKGRPVEYWLVAERISQREWADDLARQVPIYTPLER